MLISYIQSIMMIILEAQECDDSHGSCSAVKRT